MVTMIAMLVVLVLVALVLERVQDAHEAGYRRAQMGGRRGVERWASPPHWLL